MENNAQTMGKRIAAQRKKKGITQEQLSQRLGVTPQAVSKWENDLSCPDISILPSLAKELDVSVDYLLGRKNQEEQKETKEYIVITKETEGDEGMDENEKKGKVYLRFNLHDKWGAIFAALLLVGAGVLFLLQEFGVVTLAQDISIWGIVWPLLVLIAGISSMTSEFNPCTLAITFFGLYKFLYNLGLLPKEWLLTWSMAWPIIIIIVGLTILQSTLLPKKKRKHGNKSSDGKKQLVTRCGYKDGLLDVECDFGDMHPAPTGPFIGGNVEVNFGNCVLDLTQCESFAENSTLHGEVNFGELAVIVPSCVKVLMDSESAFGSCTAPASDENTTCTMTIKGECNFGNLQVKYNS